MKNRDYTEVKISLSYTQLVNLMRFYNRGVECGRCHLEEGVIYPENGKVLEKKLKDAMQEMRIVKAKSVIKKTEEA